MSLKLYYEPLSQPSRAVYIFMKLNKIPFEVKYVDLLKGEQHEPEFLKINPMSKIPVIDHNGFILTESVAIIRYLCREFKINNHWYPLDSQSQARVDEYLEWQHLNTRIHCAMFTAIKVFFPVYRGMNSSPKEIADHKDRMIKCLDQIENIWLKDKPYLAGDEISVADIIGACEIEQPRVAGYDPKEGRPRLSSWMDRVRKETAPYYEEIHVAINKMVEKHADQQS